MAKNELNACMISKNGERASSRDCSADEDAGIKHNEHYPEPLETVPNGGIPLLHAKLKGKYYSNELYKKNLCSLIAGCTLVFSSVTVIGLTLVILTNPETFGATHSTKGPNHIKIALNKYYTEFFPNFWLVSASDTTSIYYHQVELDTHTWRYVFGTEQWIWAERGPITVHTVGDNKNHSTCIVGDALLLQGNLNLSFTASPGTWISLEIPQHTAVYALFHVISSSGFYRNSTLDDKIRLYSLYPNYTSVSHDVI